MTWEIEPFEGVGPIRFGMTPSQVEAVLGPAERKRRGERGTEYRGYRAPVINYNNGGVSEIECWYDLPGVALGDIRIFEQDGVEVMRELERRNGGALESVGIVLFENLGLSCGRLDQSGREDNSITAFARGLWAERTDGMDAITFL